MKTAFHLALAASAFAAPKFMFDRKSIDLSVSSDALPDLESTEPVALFTAWQKKFGKTYSADEAEARHNTFMDNLATIKAHNELYRAGKSGYTMGLNQFTDLSADEFKATYLSTHKKTSYNPTRLPLTPLDTVDWRTKGAVTPVKNQGQCGSCWSFSTTGSVEGAWAIAGNKLIPLSEQQLMDCSTAEGDHSCQGGLMDFAFEYIEKNGGIDTESDYPYKMRNEACETAKEKNIAAMIKSHTDVPKGEASQLAAAIAKGPVSIAIEADQSGFQHYSGGVFDGTCGTRLDHGVLAVGYNADAWIVKNSWGASWGDQGYIQLSRTAGGGNQCGILNSASYPIAKDGPVPPPSPSPPSPAPSPGNWTSVEQDVYRGLNKCNGTPQTSSIPLGQCVPDSNGAFKMSCSDDGSTFTQTQFSDSGCTQQTNVVPGASATCLNAGLFTYVEFTCKA
jgi:hypothetical protein